MFPFGVEKRTPFGADSSVISVSFAWFNKKFSKWHLSQWYITCYILLWFPGQASILIIIYFFYYDYRWDKPFRERQNACVDFQNQNYLARNQDKRRDRTTSKLSPNKSTCRRGKQRVVLLQWQTKSGHMWPHSQIHDADPRIWLHPAKTPKTRRAEYLTRRRPLFY